MNKKDFKSLQKAYNAVFDENIHSCRYSVAKLANCALIPLIEGVVCV